MKKRLISSILLIAILLLPPISVYPSNGLDLSSPDGAFQGLLKAIVSGDRKLYEELLGRRLNKDELAHIADIRLSPPRRVVKIDGIKVLETGEEAIDIGNVYYIFSEQTWHFKDGRKRKMLLDLHFQKRDGIWRFIPIEGQTFLFQ